MYGTTAGTPPERILPTVGLNVGRLQVLARCRCSAEVAAVNAIKAKQHRLSS
jgi:hypothetical protein